MRQIVSQLPIYDPNKLPQADFAVDHSVSTSLLNVSSHGLAEGDIVQLSVTTEEGDALPTGLSESTNYYVLNPSTNSFQVSASLGGSPVTFSDSGVGTFTYHLKGKVIYVADFTHIVLAMHTKNDANLTFKVYGSISKEIPNFFVSKSETNVYDNVQLKDLEDNSGVDGDTGVSIAGTDDVQQYEVNTNGINYLTAEITDYTAGNLGLFATCYQEL